MPQNITLPVLRDLLNPLREQTRQLHVALLHAGRALFEAKIPGDNPTQHNVAAIFTEAAARLDIQDQRLTRILDQLGRQPNDEW